MHTELLFVCFQSYQLLSKVGSSRRASDW